MLLHPRSLDFTTAISLAYLLVLPTLAARTTSPKNAVHLSKISTLTLRAGKYTSHRRVSAVPQLKCVGPKNVCSLYEVDVMRCKNQGADYDDDNIQWTCTASLPDEFKLGSTDVICEGYESSDDPYVLKGSCGVEYRLALTDQGEEKYGDLTSSWVSRSWAETISTTIFWVLFVGILGLMVVSCFRNQAGRRPGWGGGGGGGGGFGGGPDDPPPPYDWQPPRKPRSTTSRSGGGESWTPGFWSGALGGAAAGYAMGNRNRGQQQPQQGGGFFGGGRGNAGEGSSRSSGSPSFSASRHSSTGFGSTSRR